MAIAKGDSEARRKIRQEARRKLPFLIQFGNEDDIIAYAKAWNPSISKQELEDVVRLFRDAQRERGRSQ